METIYDENLPVLERIQIPMVWKRLECGVRVEDLQPSRYEEALQIVRDFYIEDDPMCVGCKLHKEEDSIEEFLELAQFWMQDTQSFVAVDEETDEAVGLLVGRVNELEGHTKTMSRMRIHKAEVLGKMQRFLAHINRQVDLYEQFRIKAFYKVYIWCVARDHRSKGIGESLLRTAMDQTRSFKMAIIMGVFTGAISQHIARTIGFQTLIEILYWQWKEAEEPVFDNPGAGNNSAELMVYIIEEHLPVPEETQEEEEEGEEEELNEEIEEEQEVETENSVHTVLSHKTKEDS